MNRLSSVVVTLFLSAYLAGCAVTPLKRNAIPDRYDGPTAEIKDTLKNVQRSIVELFVVYKIDDELIENGLTMTNTLSRDKGFRVEPVAIRRFVQVKPLKLQIIGTHKTGAPIHALFALASGTYRTVQAELTFTPEADKLYVVTGELKEEGSSIWIEEAASGKRVTEVFRSASK